MSFLETSALDATNVTTAFECIVKGKFLIELKIDRLLTG